MSDWAEFLSTIPIFSFLGRSEMAAVQELFVESVLQKGDVVCRSGEPGDTFYVVLDGELEVWAGEDEQRMTGTLKRGDFFGEMALLQGGKRAATVIVARRARLISLGKADFDSLFLKNPKALEYFTRVLCKRLASVSKGEGVRKATTTISISSAPGLKGKTITSSALAGILHDLTGAEILLVRVRPGEGGPEGSVARLLSGDLERSTDVPPEVLESAGPGVAFLRIQATTDKPAEYYSDRTSNLISRLSERFPFMVFDLGSHPPALVEAAPSFSDVVIEIVEGAASKPAAGSGVRSLQVVNLYNPGSRPIPINHCEPFVIPSDSRLANGDAAGIVRSSPRLGAALPIHRLARKILGSTVGLALGGGAAFGIAHLGVLQVLEKHGIPIDLLAGCSQGSIIGVGYAAGISTDEMISIARDLGQGRNFFLAMDFTVSRPGLLAGNRIMEIFTPYLRGRRTFEDLVMPCRTVATDIESGERVAIGSGRLAAAFRASAAVPMVISPFRHGKRILVDGGVADPVPAEVVNAMGADLCVAVNVVPPLKRGVENAVSRIYRQVNRLNPLSYIGDSRHLPNLFDLIMNSMQVLQYELGNFKAISADVLINPDLSDFTWIEYYRAEELIQRGVDAAERAIPAIERAYAQKLAPHQRKSAA